MSATDELRKMLDERGVEWKEYGYENHTWWSGSENIDWHAVNRPSVTGLYVKIEAVLTPAQAIAATLGSEECHYIPDDVGFTWWDENDVEHCEEYSASYECGSASCDKCGYTMMVGDEGWFDGWDEITEWWEEDGSYHKGYVLRPRFKHCPNCGRKVVDA